MPGLWRQRGGRATERRRHVAVASLGIVAIVGLTLTACDSGSGYVEIKIVPSTAAKAPLLLLDSTKLDPIKDGQAILTAKAGRHKLQMEWVGGSNTLLCEVEVRKDRITTVTLSVLDRPPRCQCRHGSGDGGNKTPTCVS